jgi:hypothetical protein
VKTSKMVGRVAGPVALKTAPGLTAGWVRQAFDAAVDGVGPLRGAAEAADRRVRLHHGDVDRAIQSLIDSHVRMAGAQGFVTNIGGIVTMAVTVPVNISGLALLQCHLVGGIAHLRGYDLDDPRVRNAVLACMLGKGRVKQLVKNKRLPSTPMAIATAPQYDPSLDRRIVAEVTAELLTRVAGKRTVAALGRRVPVVGGAFGAVTDGWNTYEVGEYAAKELKARPKPALATHSPRPAKQ